jgi:hypothetical protein
MNKKGNKIISIVALLISAYFANNYIQENDDTRVNTSINPSSQSRNNNELTNLIKNKQSNKIITINAKVINILSDDRQGDKHQRLILKVGKHTLLLAHNIDLAPRVPVKKGETIQVKGEYEWNEKGGVIHWTHRSNNNHANGWIMYNNKKYY